MKKPHFKENESYLHKLAKDVLKEWIEKHPERFDLKNVTSIRFEESFCENGVVLFKPDITIYEGDKLTNIYEICHTSGLTGYKLHKMQCYYYFNPPFPNVYEIDAKYIMKQTKCPYKPLMMKYENFNDELF